MKPGRFTPTLLVCGLLGMSAGAATSVAAETVAARDLGIPVTSANLISYRAARGWGHDGGDLLCWVTTAESGGHFSAMDLGSGSVLTYPLNHLEGYPIVFGSDRRVYVGSTSGEVMRWDPRARSWGAVGKPLFAVPGRGVNHVRALCEGPGRWLYAGSCTGERARIHMDTAEVQKLPEPAEKGYWYVSAVAALPDGRIAFGFGHVARLLVYDPAKGKDTGQWLPQGWTEDGFCVNLLMGRSVLYASHSPSGRQAAFDTATGRFLGKVPWPDAVSGQQWSKWIHSSGYGSAIDFYLLPGTDTVVNCDGGRVYQFDPTRPDLPASVPTAEFVPPPELELELRWSVTTDCRVLEYDARRLHVVRSLTPAQPTVARGLHGLGTGPDGKVYGGAFQSTMLFCHDPATGRTTLLGDHHPGWSGETYSFTVRGQELICASYTNGAIVAYDPAKPWECEVGRMINPRRIGFLGQRVYRPLKHVRRGRRQGLERRPRRLGNYRRRRGVRGSGDSADRGHRAARGAARRRAVVGQPAAGVQQRPVAVVGRHGESGTRAGARLPFPLVSATLIDKGPPGRVLLAGGKELAVCCADEAGRIAILARHPSPVPCDASLGLERPGRGGRGERLRGGGPPDRRRPALLPHAAGTPLGLHDRRRRRVLPQRHALDDSSDPEVGDAALVPRARPFPLEEASWRGSDRMRFTLAIANGHVRFPRRALSVFVWAPTMVLIIGSRLSVSGRELGQAAEPAQEVGVTLLTASTRLEFTSPAQGLLLRRLVDIPTGTEFLPHAGAGRSVWEVVLLNGERKLCAVKARPGASFATERDESGATVYRLSWPKLDLPDAPAPWT